MAAVSGTSTAQVSENLLDFKESMKIKSRDRKKTGFRRFFSWMRFWKRKRVSAVHELNIRGCVVLTALDLHTNVFTSNISCAVSSNQRRCSVRNILNYCSNKLISYCTSDSRVCKLKPRDYNSTKLCISQKLQTSAVCSNLVRLRLAVRPYHCQACSLHYLLRCKHIVKIINYV